MGDFEQFSPLNCIAAESLAHAVQWENVEINEGFKNGSLRAVRVRFPSIHFEHSRKYLEYQSMRVLGSQGTV